MFFVILDRTGRSFVKWLLWQCFLDSFVFFVVKKWAVMMLFDAGFDAYFVRKNDKKRAV